MRKILKPSPIIEDLGNDETPDYVVVFGTTRKSEDAYQDIVIDRFGKPWYTGGGHTDADRIDGG